MRRISQIFAVIAILGTAITYGTDAFSALVQKPALGRVDDAALVSVMGNVHRYGDRRIPIPSVLGLLAALGAGVLAWLSGRRRQSASAASAVLLWGVWLTLYFRISSPINRKLTTAADRGETPHDARKLQGQWDRIIVLRASLLGLAVGLLAISII